MPEETVREIEKEEKTRTKQIMQKILEEGGIKSNTSEKWEEKSQADRHKQLPNNNPVRTSARRPWRG